MCLSGILDLQHHGERAAEAIEMCTLLRLASDEILSDHSCFDRLAVIEVSVRELNLCLIKSALELSVDANLDELQQRGNVARTTRGVLRELRGRFGEIRCGDRRVRHGVHARVCRVRIALADRPTGRQQPMTQLAIAVEQLGHQLARRFDPVGAEIELDERSEQHGIVAGRLPIEILAR